MKARRRIRCASLADSGTGPLFTTGLVQVIIDSIKPNTPAFRFKALEPGMILKECRGQDTVRLATATATFAFLTGCSCSGPAGVR